MPQRFETVFFNVADKRDRDKEFERGLHLSKKEALTLANESFDIIQILEDARLKPQLLVSQPHLNMPPLTFSANSNKLTLLNMMVQMVPEIHNPTGQIMTLQKRGKER